MAEDLRRVGEQLELFGPADTAERREIDAAIRAALDEARDAMLSQSVTVTWQQGVD